MNSYQGITSAPAYSGIFCSSWTCKPNSVCQIAPAGRPFLWAAHHCAALATYPKVLARRAGTRPPPLPNEQ